MPKSSAPGLPPPNQIAAAGISEMPIMVIRLPITTGGKNRSRRLNTGARAMVIAPAAITAPKIWLRPNSLPIMIIGARAMNEQPWIIGRRAPNFQKPRVWISVATPEVSKLALISMTICAEVKPRALPRIKGTATAPAYITSTCCRPKVNNWRNGRISSTG
ncbi:hypothetical protein D3C76_968220 [compost metagenome]